MGFETIIFESREGVARLTLNRPERLNAFSSRMHAEVAEALDALEADRGLRVLLLTGAGRAFCAGQDLGERDTRNGSPDLGMSTETQYNPLVRRLTALPAPVVCAVNGVAAGAGMSIALACDIVLARRSARFVQAFAGIGLIPDAAGTWHLPRLVGQARALAFTLTGGSLSADEAAAWGMIWKVLDDEGWEAGVEAIVEPLGHAPTQALAMAKRAIRQSFFSPLEAQLDLERDFQRACGWTEDYREGVIAFKERRPPRFRGK